MKKVLIFWAWNQWSKYIDFFNSKGYIIDLVTKTWFTKIDSSKFIEIYKYSNLLKLNNSFFQDYFYIVVAVSPYTETEILLKDLYCRNLNNFILVEKPVSYDLDFLSKLVFKENYYFFIDELILWKYFTKFLWLDTLIIISIFENHTLYNINLLEHILWIFITFDNFDSILSNITIKFNKNNFDYFYYEIFISKYFIKCIKGYFFINDKLFYKLRFKNSLDFLLSVSKENNLLYKKNFLILRSYLTNYFK